MPIHPWTASRVKEAKKQTSRWKSKKHNRKRRRNTDRWPQGRIQLPHRHACSSYLSKEGKARQARRGNLSNGRMRRVGRDRISKQRIEGRNETGKRTNGEEMPVAGSVSAFAAPPTAKPTGFRPLSIRREESGLAALPSAPASRLPAEPELGVADLAIYYGVSGQMVGYIQGFGAAFIHQQTCTFYMEVERTQ